MKKTLHILLRILGVLFLIFFLAGLFVPAVEYETEITINKSIDEVWEKYNDLDQLSNLIPAVSHIKVIKETPDKIGSQYEMVVNNNGQSMKMTETVVEYVENEKVFIEFNAGTMIKTDETFFTGDSTSTHIKSHHSCKGNNYIHRCMFAFFKSMFLNIDQTYMNQFKIWIET